MKVKRLTESNKVVRKQHLTEDVDQVRARVREFLEERLDAATDNIAIELAHEVKGYNPDWCYKEFYGNFIDQLTKARITFLNKLESLLFAEAPMNEAIKEAVDMSAMKYAVVKPNGEYAGVPCETVDEAREMAAQEEGRVVFKLSKVLFGESYHEESNPEKCDKCGTLLNDMSTCSKCDDDGEPEDDIDESIVMESANNYYFQHGDEVLEGMNGNLSENDLNYQIKYLSRIARKLGLKRVEDLVLFCDDEGIYDPTMFDNRFFTLSEQPKVFNVNGVTFIAAKEFNQIWLYFRNEADGAAYLGYCDAQS